MKKLLCFLVLTASCFGTTSVTGHLSTLGTGNAGSANNAYVRLWLRGCRGNQPRVTGTGAIAPQTNGSAFYVDLPADASGNVSGTVYSTRDAAGTGNGEIDCGGSYTAVWYGMVVYSDGVAGPEVPIHAKSGATLDISNVTPITTPPVTVAPTGDSTYLRKDFGNSPVTGNGEFSGSVTFSGGLTGTLTGSASQLETKTWESPGTIGSSTPNTGAFSTVTSTNSGSFTTSEYDYLKSNVNSCDPQTEIQAGQGGSFWNVSAITGCIKYAAGGTNTQVTGLAGLASGPGTWSLNGHGALVGVYGQGRCTADNCDGWGGNLIYEDDGSRTTGMSGHGLEIDVGQHSPNTAYSNLFGVVASLGGNGTGLVTNSYAYEAGVQSTPHNLQWNWAFYSQDGGAANGAYFGATCQSGTCDSQPITFGVKSASTSHTGNILMTSGGDIAVNPYSTSRYFNVNGNLGLIESATGTPTGGAGVIWADSATHTLKASFGGDGFSQIARLGATQSWSEVQTFSSGIVPGNSAAPTCDASHRGIFWYQPGGAGVKDVVQVCAKDVADAYAWRSIY